jgi:hypothetical protein
MSEILVGCSRKMEEEERQQTEQEQKLDYLAQTRGWQVPDAFSDPETRDSVPGLQRDADECLQPPSPEECVPLLPATDAATLWEPLLGKSVEILQEPLPEECSARDPGPEGTAHLDLSQEPMREDTPQPEVHLENVVIRDTEGREIYVQINPTRGMSPDARNLALCLTFIAGEERRKVGGSEREALENVEMRVHIQRKWENKENGTPIVEEGRGRREKLYNSKHVRR